jgi:hypothetical protein
MGLARPIIWLLVVLWLASFVCFVVVSQLAFVSGTTFEYRLYGVHFPYLAFASMACMAASSGLLWANYRGVDLSGAEETIYGALFGVSVFGLMLSAMLALMA